MIEVIDVSLYQGFGYFCGLSLVRVRSVSLFGAMVYGVLVVGILVCALDYPVTICDFTHFLQ